MDENPYEPIAASDGAKDTAVQHGISVRSEAWLGFKFGARITGIVMSAIAALVGLGMVFIAIVAVIQTSGEILRTANYLEIAKGIGGSVFAVILMSFYGGVAGSIIMAIAAVLRKQRNRRTAG